MQNTLLPISPKSTSQSLPKYIHPIKISLASVAALVPYMSMNLRLELDSVMPAAITLTD